MFCSWVREKRNYGEKEQKKTWCQTKGSPEGISKMSKTLKLDGTWKAHENFTSQTHFLDLRPWKYKTQIWIVALICCQSEVIHCLRFQKTGTGSGNDAFKRPISYMYLPHIHIRVTSEFLHICLFTHAAYFRRNSDMLMCFAYWSDVWYVICTLKQTPCITCTWPNPSPLCRSALNLPLHCQILSHFFVPQKSFFFTR